MNRRPKSSELKGQARELLMGRHGFLALVTFLLSMLYLLASFLLNSAFPSTGGTMNLVLGLAGSLIVNIVYYLFCAGQAEIYLNLCRGQDMRLGQLSGPFSNRPEPIAVFAVVQFLIQTVSVNLGLWILPDLLNETDSTKLLPMYGILLVLLVVSVWLELGLSMVFFLYCDDPQKSGMQLIRESFRLMRGSRRRMLFLLLSFIGVMLLGMLSAGIGLLFARPYLNTVQALFYLNLVEDAHGEQTSTSTSAGVDAFI